MNGQTIIDRMLAKAKEYEDAGNKELADYWLNRAMETEERLKNLGEHHTL